MPAFTTALNAGLSLAKAPPELRENVRNLRLLTLLPGQYLYRFGDSRLSAGENLASPWWSFQDGFERIWRAWKEECARHGDDALDLGFLARSASALGTWTRADVVVVADLRVPVEAFCGEGRTVHRQMSKNGMMWTFRGWEAVTQIYVPGLRDERRVPTPALGTALRLVRQITVKSYPLF